MRRGGEIEDYVMRRFLIAGCLSLLAATGCSSIQAERSFGREVDDNTASFGIKSAMIVVHVIRKCFGFTNLCT